MKNLISKNWNLLLACLSLIVSGLYGGFVISTILTVLFFLGFYKSSPEKSLCIFFFVFILADNVYTNLNVFGDIRFIVIGLTFLLSAKSINQRNLGFYLIPFTILALLITILNLSGYLSDAILRCVGFLCIALILFGFAKNMFFYNPQKTVVAFLAFFFFIYLIPLFMYFLPEYSIFHVTGRYKGIMENPNGLALLSILIFPLLDIFKRYYPRRGHINVLQVIIFISVFFSGSRNGILCLAIYMGGKIFFNTKYRNLVYILAIIAGIFINMVDWNEMAFDNWFLNHWRIENIENASGRTDVWKAVAEKIKKEPLVGNGMLYDTFFIKQYATEAGEIGRQWNAVWNSYFVFLLDVGIIGLMVYFFFIYKMYRSSRDKQLSIPFLIIVLLSAIPESWMASSLNVFTPLFYFYFSIQSGLKPEIKK